MRFTALLLDKHQGLRLMICVKITQPFNAMYCCGVMAGERAGAASRTAPAVRSAVQKMVDSTNRSAIHAAC